MNAETCEVGSGGLGEKTPRRWGGGDVEPGPRGPGGAARVARGATRTGGRSRAPLGRVPAQERSRTLRRNPGGYEGQVFGMRVLLPARPGPSAEPGELQGE